MQYWVKDTLKGVKKLIHVLWSLFIGFDILVAVVVEEVVVVY